MDFKILGPPELSGSRSRDGKLTPQLWGVLASLLMAGGKPVSVDSLVSHLWGWNPPPRATATIRTYVSRINTLLAKDDMRISRRLGGYLLAADPQGVDLHRFRSLRCQAESVIESGHRDHAASLLRQADELWRGSALQGLNGEWATSQGRVLDDERREAIKLRIGIDLDLGRQANVLSELRELSADDPFDEEVTRELMICLYRLGRQQEAMQVGRNVSERFAEAGMEPSQQLRDLHSQILRGDAGLRVTPAYRKSGQGGQPNTLPTEVPDFVGREEEMRGLLKAGREGNRSTLEVIEGIAGVGKTALAVRVAHRITANYPDAQLYVAFTEKGPDSVTEALHRLLRMLEIPAARIPAEAGERAKMWRAEMTYRRAVIVLDDVTEPSQVAPIIPDGNSLTIITSRQQAEWPSRSVLRLKPLGAGDAVTLLRRLADPAADQDAGKISVAASLCGGLPLAIRVAAGRLRDGDLIDLDSLIDELTDLHAGRADDTEAGRRIFSAFEFTYRQLTSESKRMFRLLGVSPCGDFSSKAAAILAGEDTGTAVRNVEGLCESYLLERVSPDRFRLHHLIRSYAVACCAREDSETERKRSTTRLIHYFYDALRAAAAGDYEFFHQNGTPPADPGFNEPSVKLPDTDFAQAWLETEWRNILLTARHAARHEQHSQCAELAHALAGFLHTGGYWSDAVPAHELALQACRIIGDQTRIPQAALDLSAACRRTGNHDKARHLAREALSAYIELGDLRGQAAALDQLGIICWSSGSARDMLAYHQEAEDLYRDAGDKSGTATAVMHAATALGGLGRYAEEIRHLSRALRLFQEAGDRRGEAICLNNLGAVLDDQGLHRDAIAHYEKSSAIFREIGGRQNLALLDHNLGRVQSYKGNHEVAIAIFRKALSAYNAIGDLRHQAIALSDIGAAFRAKEAYSEALAHYSRSAELAEAVGDKSQLATALCGLADAYRGSGSYAVAVETYARAHSLAAEIEAPYLSGKTLYGLAETVLVTQGVGAAKIYWRQALDIFTQLGVQEAAMVEIRLHGRGASAS